MLKTLFVLEIFLFLLRLLGYDKNRLIRKQGLISKYYDVTDWATNNYNTPIGQYLNVSRDKRNQAKKFGQLK